MISDTPSQVLGLVATNWLITADYSSLGIFDPDCYTLAQIHSNAVDYPKSGQPVQHTEIPKIKIKIRPDWHAPETISDITGKFYESTRAIGRYVTRMIECSHTHSSSGCSETSISLLCMSLAKSSADREKHCRTAKNALFRSWLMASTPWKQIVGTCSIFTFGLKDMSSPRGSWTCLL
jgi:hypothetical protein